MVNIEIVHVNKSSLVYSIILNERDSDVKTFGTPQLVTFLTQTRYGGGGWLLEKGPFGLKMFLRKSIFI